MSDKKTILIVDDDAAILSVLAESLERDYKVLLAGDGVDSVYVYERNIDQVAAIVTDLEMPRLNGQTLADWVHHICPQLPVIIMSGNFRKVALSDLQRRPMTSFLGKPFDPSELEAVLQRVLDIHGQPV